MQSIEEKIYEVFWDKNIARMINRADLFSFLKQYVNPGLLTRSSKSELVHDLKEYMTTANLEFIAERMESFGLRRYIKIWKLRQQQWLLRSRQKGTR